MSSKINGIDTRTGPIGAGRAVDRVKDANAEGKNPASELNSIDVEITGSARHLAALEQALSNQPAVDEARVATIRSAIEQGRYTYSPHRIADQLLQVERVLGRLER